MTPQESVLLPAESMAFTVARAQLLRGDNPPINITAALVLTIERLVVLLPVSPESDTTAPVECEHEIEEVCVLCHRPAHEIFAAVPLSDKGEET